MRFNPVLTSATMSVVSLITAIGNVVQVINFGTKLCYRIKEYSTTNGAPKKLVAWASCLSDLLCVLDGLAEAEQEALEQDLISRCTQTAMELIALLDTVIDRKGHTKYKWRYARKAWKSLYLEKQFEGLQRTLENQLGPLSLHLQVKTT